MVRIHTSILISMAQDKAFKSRLGRLDFGEKYLKILLQTSLVLFYTCCVHTSVGEEHPEVKDPDKIEMIGNYSISDTFLEEHQLTPKEFQKILLDGDIIPDCIDAPPNHTVQVQFYHGYIAKLGNLIPPENITDHSPHFVKWPGYINELFTLILVDLDEPSRLQPDKREWLHWMIVNIPGWTRYLGELKCRYVPPQPQEGSGKHRYVFIVYKQPEQINFTDLKLINGTNHNDIRRGNFSNRSFSKKYNLGDPWAVNFFQAQYYVPPKNTYA